MHQSCINSGYTNSLEVWRGGQDIPPLFETLLVIDSGWERKIAFFKDADFGKAVLLQWKSTHAKIFGKHKLGFIGFVVAVLVFLKK